MRRVSGYILIITITAAVLWLGWIFFGKINEEKKDPLDAVPQSAAVIIKLNDPLRTWNNLSNSNLMWDGLRTVSPFDIINRTGKKADSLIKVNKQLALLLTGSPLVISIHYQGSGKAGLIFTVTGEQSEEEMVKLIGGIISKSNPPSERQFKDDKIWECVFGKNKFYLVVKNGFISLASNPGLSEEVITHIDEGIKFSSLKDFSTINNTAEPKADAAIYINHSTFNSLLQSFVSPWHKELFQQAHPYALFSEFDLHISSGSFSMNGFSDISDSAVTFLSVFKDQQPQDFTAGKIIPENVSGYVWMGFNDGEIFFAALDNYYSGKNLLVKRQENIKVFESENDCNLKASFIPWIGNEIVLYSVPGNANGESAAETFLAIRCNDLADPVSLLNILSEKLDTSYTSSANENERDIRQLNNEEIFSLLFGELFSSVKKPWYIRVDDFVIFCTNKDALNRSLTDISSDRSLSKNITYHNFVSHHFSGKSNITVYSHLPYFSSQIIRMADSSLSATLAGNSELLNKFETFSWQMTNNGKNMFYNNFFLGYNSSGKQNSDALWEITLDTTFNFTPAFVKNHVTNTHDVFVQDDNYSAYLINNKGELMWKKALEEKITGEVKQIDYFSNGKLQLIFCTSTQLHLIDIRGIYVEGFPLNLQQEVTATPAIFDYDKNGDYRICIAAGKNIINLEKNGKPVTGWTFSGAEADIVQSPEFFRVDNKDYIFTCDSKGNLYVLDRKGKERYSVNLTLDNRSANPFFLEPGKNIETTRIIYSDSGGTIRKVYFNGNIDSVNPRHVSYDHYFTMFDVNNDREKEFILLDSSKITAHDRNNKLIFSCTVPADVIKKLSCATGTDGNFFAGVTGPVNAEIFVIRSDGTIHPQFPLAGTSLFQFSDINNDGSMEIAVSNGSNRLFIYSFK